MFTKSGVRYQEHRRKHEVIECIKGLKYVLRADDHLRKSGILKKNTLSLNWAQANSLTTVIKEPMALEYRSEWYQTFFMKEYASLTLSVQPNVRRRMSMAFPGFYGIAPWHFLSKILANICFLSPNRADRWDLLTKILSKKSNGSTTVCKSHKLIHNGIANCEHLSLEYKYRISKIDFFFLNLFLQNRWFNDPRAPENEYLF